MLRNFSLFSNYYRWVIEVNKQNIIMIVVLVVGVIGFYVIDSFINNNKDDTVLEIEDLSYVDIRVSGAVLRSGEYHLPSDLTIESLFNMVGLKDDADISSFNLNDKLIDKKEYSVPYIDELKDIYVNEGYLININTATIEELMKLDGIGEGIAKRIIDYRENNLFKSIEEIKNVSGIGDKVYEKIKNRITV